MGKDKNNNGIDLRHYQDPEKPSLKKMAFGLWLSENRRRLNRILITILAGVSLFFFAYSIYNYILYFQGNSLPPEESIVSSQKDLTSPLAIASVKAFKVGNSFDLVAQVKNPNPAFQASFEYCFSSGDVEQACGQSFILPGTEKLVVSWNQTIADSADLKFVIKDISWKRIDAHEIPDWAAFSASRLKFVFSDVKFVPASANSLSAKVNLNSLDFNLSNESAYSYYQVPLIIALYRGSDLVGVHYFVASDLIAGENRPVSLSWAGNLGNVSEVRIFPDVNILDDDVYSRYRGNR